MSSDQKLAQRQSKSIGDDGRRSRIAGVGLLALSALCCGHGAANAQNQPQSACKETVVAKVVALDQAFYVNRYGALQAGGMVFALERDVVSMDPGNPALQAGKVMVRSDKRPRPLTLRVNKGQCLEIQFRNLLSPKPVNQNVAVFPPVPAGGYQPNQQQLVPSNGNLGDANGNQSQPPTRYAGVHVDGMEWVNSSTDDGTFVGANDVAANDLGGKSKLNGLIPPEQAPLNQRITYTLFAAEEGAFLLTSGGTTVGDRLDFGGQVSEGLFGSVVVQPPTAEYYRSQVSRAELDAATVNSTALPEGWRLGPAGPSCTSYQGDRSVIRELTRNPKDQYDPNRGTSCVKAMADGFLYTLGDQPVINYDAVFGPQAKRPGAPVLSMLTGKRGEPRRELVASDLTAMITGPYAWMFGPTKAPTKNDAYPEQQQPYREFAIHYHDDFMAIQAFAAFRNGGMQYTLQGGRDFFAINYGMGGIGAIVWANRLKIGPANECATCKFEEFFLSSWPNGDPAMVVDQPVNVSELKLPTQTLASKAFYPDDPSNVYHSYLRDHVKFRILHAGTNITHVHHQHAHQWLHSPKSGVSAYRDSQMISPGAAYTLDMVYGGGGNKNLTVGDSIFHCHFYPHFAQGMWALWRVHDVFERGTRIAANGEAAFDGPNRALPDGEIAHGTPIPGLVPLPTLAMAPNPARVEIKSVQETAPGGEKVNRYAVAVNPDDLKAGLQPGYPFFIPGIAGQRAPHPPMSYAPELDANGNQVEIAGQKQRLDGGLPRNVAVAELGSSYEQHNRWDFSKDNDQLFARELAEEGDAVERATMKVYQTRNHPSFTSVGTPVPFVYNGQPAVRGAPFANPGVHYNGDPVKVCEATDPNCNGKDFEGRKLTYKSANIQTDVALNKKGWHYPQQRMSVLWDDVKPTLDGKRRPEPLFMRANSGDIVEFWLTNLIPNYYELDDFQVRTPTDVVGQHIHLVKFDVLASDGAGNGWNYESGSLAAEEVRGLIGAINKAGGMVGPGGTAKTLTAKTIPDLAQHFPTKGDPLILGAQATVELWYVDPLTDICRPDDQKEVCPKDGLDRTMGTVFTHDHFGPSTHQQAGLYAGLIIEPADSQWLTATALAPMGGNDPSTGKPVKTRADGGPTSWAAVIKDKDKLYREFLIEFQDRQLTYSAASRAQPKPYQRYQPKTPGIVNRVNPDGAWGWTDTAASVNPPVDTSNAPQFKPNPQLVTNSFGAGAWSLNYRNEPLDFRLAGGTPNANSATDTAFAFASIQRTDASLNVQPTGPIAPINPCAAVKADVTILGDLAPGPVWLVNGKILTNNGSVPLKAGQVVCFGVRAGLHGLLFPTQAVGNSVFNIAASPQASSFVPNPKGPTTCGKANTFGTVPQTSGIIAVLHVLDNVTLSTPAPFECSQHCGNMAGSFAVDDTLNIAGDQDANNNHFWTVDGKRLDNNGSVSLKRGQLVRFTVKAGTHGLLFKNQAAAQAVFDIASSPQASKFIANPNGPNTCSLASSYGTTPQATVTTNPTPGQNTIAELRVLANATISGALDFECSQHCANMAGSFEIGEVLDIVADQDTLGNHWVVDGNRMANGNTLQLTAGQRVRFSVMAGTHGLLFTDQATADAIFDIAGSPQAAKFVLNPVGPSTCGFANSYGTVPQAAVTTNPLPGQNIIAELVVKQSVTLAQPGGWMCSQHCQNMQGLFVPEDTGFLVADPGKLRWLVDNEELANNTALPLVPGSKLRFSANAPGDTLFFPDKTAPAALFENASAFTSMNQCTFNDGVGLALAAGSFTELTVKKQSTLLSARFMSANKCVAMEGLAQPVIPVPVFAFAPKFEGAEPFDPYTPLLRAYPGDTVEVRTLVGAHMAPHSLNMHGVKWLFEQNSPNSGFRSTQGMGISEYYQMRFNVPTTNGGADYLYAPTSDTKGLEYGQWGLLRSYSSPQADLPPIKSAAAAVADVCAAGAPAKSKYNVSAVAAQLAIDDGKLFYNSRGSSRGVEPGGGDAGKIFGDGALLYVHDEDLVDVNANPVKIKPGKRIEPLVLRAAAGDCIEITLTNRLPPGLNQTRPGSGTFGNITMATSLQVGLHPQQVGMDILAGNGVNLGKNPTQTLTPGQSKTLKWYAGSIEADGTHTPVELGAIGLSPADPLMQHPFGLLGALVIEPPGATWQTDSNGRSQATVALPSGRQFREFVVVLQDDVQKLSATDPSKAVCAASSPTSVTTVAVNYRTEPLACRYYTDADKFDTADPSLAALGMARALSNSQVLADPQTPVLAVSKGVPTRLRVVHPGGLSEQVFTLAGHPWLEEPFRNNSREIGDNAASQAFGARDSFGANDQFNIVLNSAGGRKQTTGDYLYRSFIGSAFEDGLWGVMRVGEPNSDIVAIAHASNNRGPGYIISGTNTVNPNNGKMANNVTITANVTAPNTPGPKPVTCAVPVDPVTGHWDTSSCPPALQGTLVVDANRPVTVASTEGGRAAVTGPVPSTPPSQPSFAEVAMSMQRAAPKKPIVEKKELIQFRGSPTPQATIMPLRTEPGGPVDPIVPTGRPPRGANNDEGLVRPSTPAATIHPPDH